MADLDADAPRVAEADSDVGDAPRIPQEGEAWAYRARYRDPLVQVVVEKIGSRRPPRILVRFIDPEFEGLEDWIPPARLKVPWADAADYEARERRWDAVLATSEEADEREIDAAGTVLEKLVPEVIAHMSRYDSGVLVVGDASAWPS
jgi:hypothetical protein